MPALRIRHFVAAAAVLCTALGLVLTGSQTTAQTAAPAQGNEGFVPAFAAEQIDLANTKTFSNGKATAADEKVLSRALGLTATAADVNFEKDRWTAGKVDSGEGNTFDYLVTLKAPTVVGTIEVEPADFADNTGSKNNGEVFVLKPDVAGAPNPADAAQWMKIEYAPVSPLHRFAVLPPETKSRAFLYRDVRGAGESSLGELRFYKARLGNITPFAKAYSAGGATAGDPDGVTRGEGWGSFVTASGAKPIPIDAKNPSWFIVSWDKPQDVAALFFSSNIVTCTISRFKGDASANIALAPASDWEKLPATAVTRDALHKFQWWGYHKRWVNLPGGATRAIRIDITATEGPTAWINGLGAYADLKAGPVPTVTPRDDRAPFRMPAPAADGQTAAAIETGEGVRILNLMAQTELPKGTKEIAWNLKGPDGKYVAPGKYRLRAITGPLLDLVYAHTPYPNIQNFFQDRVPWLSSHEGPHGWLSDHSQNWAVTSVGDRMYFGAPMAEAGVCFIETDLDGKKQWGKHDFGAWLGVNRLTSDGKSVFIEATNSVMYRMDPDTRKIDKLFDIHRTGRSGDLASIAAVDNKVLLAFTGGGSAKLITNATDSIDVPNSYPKGEVWQLLRIRDFVPGNKVDPFANKPQGNGNLFIETNESSDDSVYSVIAFMQPTRIGSIVWPHPVSKNKLEISYLNADAPYPPKPSRDRDWTALPNQGRPGYWECLTAPENTTTRAIRLKFSRPAAMAMSEEKWFDRAEGMKILSARFKDLSTTASIKVNSGKLAPSGEWEGQREEPISEEKPGIYMMEWQTPQKIDGLAIKEIEGARAEIDVWTGEGAPTVEGDANWKNVASYKQKRRTAQYQGDDNQFARYLDGYVEFREKKGELSPQTTRAIRLRIVEAWFDNKNGACLRQDRPIGHGEHISQSYIMNLDTRRCKVYGVVPLQALEAPGSTTPPLVAYRLEVHDGSTGALLKEFPLNLGWHGMSRGPNGEVYAINANHREILKINIETGETTTLFKGEPAGMTVGPDGNFYILSYTKDADSVVQVVDPTGKVLRTIGHPGGKVVGAWDPMRMYAWVSSMSVDKNMHLWLVESGNTPRRVLEYDAKTGELLKEILGCTGYGGSGTLNRYDVSRAYLGNIEFSIDYAKNHSKVNQLMVDPYYGGDLTALKAGGHTYLVTAPITLEDRQSVPTVYLADEGKPVRLAAAFGNADNFSPLRAGPLISRLKGKAPKDFKFIWADVNGNGKVDADEVQFEPRAPGDGGLHYGPFDNKFGVTGTDAYYAPKEFLANGTPVFERKLVPAAKSAYLMLDNGNYLSLHSNPPGGGGDENFVLDPSGRKLWGYPASGGVSGLFIPPWKPGNVTNEFGIIGHETDPGALGEFIVTAANDGQWRIWTADGLLAGQVLLHKTDGRAHFLSMPNILPGARLDPLTGSQEHFHGFFTRAEATGKYYIIMGFTSMNVIEVRGFDRFKRVNHEFTVTSADIQKSREWEATQAQRLAESRPTLLKAKQVDPLDEEAPKIDGLRKGKEYGEAAVMGDEPGNTFSMSYDDKKLYVCWTGKGIGPFKNSGGNDFQRFFKTGGAVDLQLGTDPAADPKRTKPVAGDMRLLITSVDGKYRVVLYQPFAAGAKPGEAWRTFTTAGGETAFQRVVELTDVKVAAQGGKDFTVEAAIPLSDLSFKPKKGLRLKMDWGFLITDDGNQVKQRLYWSNAQATGTADEAVEARLEPHMWGYVAF